MVTRSHIAAVLEAAGVAAGAAAGFTVDVALGLAVLAVGLVLFGLALERAS